MPKDVDIRPGQKFHQPAAQEANLTNLLKILSKKEATETLTAIAKVDKSTWSDINESVSGLKDFVYAGGLSTITQQIQDTIRLQIEDVLAPLTNEINQMIVDLLNPLMEKLTPLINDLAQFIADNKEGAMVGSIVGGVAGLFLPGGPVLVALGALIGSALQAFFESVGGITEAHESMTSMEAMLAYYEEFGVAARPSSRHYIEWWLRKYHPYAFE